MKKVILFFVFAIGFVAVSYAQQDTTLTQYTGKYKFPDGSVIAEVTVGLDNGALVAGTSYGNSALVKESDDLYVIVAFQGKALFKRDNNKKIVGVTISAMGYQLEGTKDNGIAIYNDVYSDITKQFQLELFHQKLPRQNLIFQ
ncbi:MAG: hypothetical protein H7068_09655 [Pedobacter sp.]|nr:hypothetical protein [Chitinophagaceae bacterium]